MLSEVELHQQLIDWNRTDSRYPSEASAHELIAEQTQRTPHAVAVVCGDERLTYAELQQHAKRIARRVRDLNEGRGVVAICVERSVDMLAGMLGIWKRGAPRTFRWIRTTPRTGSRSCSRTPARRCC